MGQNTIQQLHPAAHTINTADPCAANSTPRAKCELETGGLEAGQSRLEFVFKVVPWPQQWDATREMNINCFQNANIAAV